tara:strand:+ start:1034 stop:1189 length:156 start_codon:yes stop_codon:yes gene_type:complete
MTTEQMKMTNEADRYVPPSEEVAEADRKAAAKLLPDDTPVTMATLKALGYV